VELKVVFARVQARSCIAWYYVLTCHVARCRVGGLSAHLTARGNVTRRSVLLDFDFDIHTRRKVQAHEHINRLGIGIQNVNQAVVSADFKVLVRILVDET